jgi:hypothetical protein
MAMQLTIPELDNLTQVNEEVKNEIESLREFINNEPAKRRKAEIERMQTLPAPDEIITVRREKEFFDRLSRGELKNEHRHQAKNGVIFIFLALAILAVCLWIYRFVS